MAKSTKPIWIGGTFSAILLVAFFLVQHLKSELLGLPVQYLLLAILPLAIGLLMSGYIKEVKAGDLGFTMAADALANSTPIPDSGVDSASPKTVTSESWQNCRAKEYTRTNGYMLAHVYRPSNEDGQQFDVSIFVVRHRKGTAAPPTQNLEEIERAEFFFGESWGNRVFEANNKNGFFGVRTHAWGTFLAMCRLSFKDTSQTPLILYRYVDFSMAGRKYE